MSASNANRFANLGDDSDDDSLESSPSSSGKNNALQKGLTVKFTEGVVTFVANPTKETLDSKKTEEVKKIVHELGRKVLGMISNSFQVPLSTSEVAKAVAFTVCKIKDVNVLYNVLCSLERFAKDAPFIQSFQKVSFTNGTMTIDIRKLAYELSEKIDIISRLVSFDESAAIAAILDGYRYKRDIFYDIVIEKYPGKKFVVSYETYKKDEGLDTTATAKVGGSDTTATAKVGGSIITPTKKDGSSDDED